MNQPSTHLHALLVGIDDYAGKPLDGCVNDINHVEKFLSECIDIKTTVTRLTDKDATKTAIVNAFRDITENAKEDHTVLFFFAGHGVREEADEAWKETNRALECIVCYNSTSRHYPDFFLADKELRYLIYKLSQTGAHIVTIFDCCHSGDNTRDLVLDAAYPRYKERVFDHRVYDQREWHEFIFAPDIPFDSIQGRHPDEFLKQGSHIQFSACASDEKAIELDHVGAFTDALIKLLRNSGGNLSYQSLRSRVRQYMRFVFKQQPDIYVVPSEKNTREDLLYTTFLNRNIEKGQHVAEATYNSKKGWILNLGAIHGMTKQRKVQIIHPEQADKLYDVSINTIYADYSILGMLNSELKQYAVCKAIVTGIEPRVLSLLLNNNTDKLDNLKQIADDIQNNSAGYFTWAESAETADYSLEINNGEAYLAYPPEPQRPLFEPIKISSVNIIGDNIKHAAKWQFIKELTNKEPNGFPAEPLKIEIFKGNDEILQGAKSIELHLEKINGEWAGAYKIKLTNILDQQLYVGVAYVEVGFGVNVGLLAGQVKLLQQKNSSVYLGAAIAAGDPVLNVSLLEYIKNFNWPSYTETFKFIVSDQQFDMAGLFLERLKLPGERSSTRSFDAPPPLPPVQFTGWTVQTLDVTFINPEYDPAKP